MIATTCGGPRDFAPQPQLFIPKFRKVALRGGERAPRGEGTGLVMSCDVLGEWMVSGGHEVRPDREGYLVDPNPGSIAGEPQISASKR